MFMILIVFYQSRDHSTRGGRLPISGPWWPCAHLAQLLKYGAPNIMGVTTLTFWGHVTSSVTWPFDSRWSTFYGWSIMRLSSTVMEIWPFEVLPGRLFQEQRSVVGWSVGQSSILHWSYTLFFVTLGT